MLKNRWTELERARLRELRPHLKLTQIADILGRPRGSVAHEAARLKLFRPNGTNWTEQEMARIAQLWPNYSASQIGEKLGRSRNAVIGVIHRGREKMKLKPKSTARVRPLPDDRYRNGEPGITPPETLRTGKPKPQPRPRRAMLPMQCPCQLIDLDDINCRWPYGDPHVAGFYFCGALVVEGRRYCSVHLRAATI